MTPGNLMTVVKSKPIRLAIAVLIICGCSLAQDQNSNDGHAKEKWLLCDVDWIFTPYDVGPDFSVKLWFRQTPLPGIRVVLTPTGESTDASGHSRAPITAVTDSSGTAHFLAVPAGRYDAGAKNGLFFPSNEVTVHTDGDFDNEIEIEWPLQPLPVRALRGKLIAPGESAVANRPLRSAMVQLVDLHSSRVLETQRTIADGSYGFSTTESGLYGVRIIPPAKDKKTEAASGDLAVELDPAAQESTIPELKVLQSDCAGVQVLRRIAEDRWESP
jgi:hypothetical protein